MIELSIANARALQLHVMGLAHTASMVATQARLAKTLETMQLLQLDTISVVNRSHFLVLYARLGHFPIQWLDQMLVDKKLFEVWAHEACLAPQSMFWLLHAHRNDRQHWSKKRLASIMATDRAGMKQMLAQVEKNGPVKSSDFQRQDGAAPRAGWWDWKPQKRYLEAWFAAGELMVLRREGFARVYDLAHRVKPELAQPHLVEAAKTRHAPHLLEAQMQLAAIKALGITPARWVNDFFRTTPYVRDHQLQPLVDAGHLLPVTVENSAVTWYVHADYKKLLQNAANQTLSAPDHCALLSPFDPLVWHRERASALFDFNYRIECYTPQEKRRYGYFTLPILYEDKLIGRVDAKAHRADQVLEIKALHFEASVKIDERLIDRLAHTINQFAIWHACPKVTITKVFKPGVVMALRAACKRQAQ
jgi:uncharacterized protein